ncbi:urease accessory protein UreF [Curvivirga sp.]|uniref:urease accessory protein UreF n=1 Tax=Curvivirga sp. TaxID=2856848 RepID=UPI003B590BD0
MLTNIGLMKLMTWLSPSFPVGAYTYSHGLEYAVEEGFVKDGDELKTWVEGILKFGAGKTDGMFFCEAHRLVRIGEVEGVFDLNQFAIVLRPTKEMALESEAQGRAFHAISADLSDHPMMQVLSDGFKKSNCLPSYPVIVGAVSAIENIDMEAALVAYLHAMAANIISAGVRLIPLGQTAGQKALVGLEEVIQETLELILEADFDDIGAASPIIDWTSMKHETQYTRLFRS